MLCFKVVVFADPCVEALDSPVGVMPIGEASMVLCFKAVVFAGTGVEAIGSPVDVMPEGVASIGGAPVAADSVGS